MTLMIDANQPVLGPFVSITIIEVSVASLSLVTLASNFTGAWTFTNSNPAVTRLVGNVVTPLAFGSTVITATWAVARGFSSASISITLTIKGTSPTLGSFPDATTAYDLTTSHTVTLTPPTSNLPGELKLVSDNPSVVEIVGTTAKVKAAGLVNITATQVATQFFASATSHISVSVYGAIPTLGVFAPIEGVVSYLAITIKAPISNSIGTWVFTSSNTKVAVVTGGTLKIVGVGTATLMATQKIHGIYSQSNTVQSRVTGRTAAQVLVPSGPAPKPTPTAKSTTEPTTAPSANPVVKVNVLNRVLTVSVTGASAAVTINGAKARVGKNTLKPGLYIVIVSIAKKIVFSKTYRIK